MGLFQRRSKTTVPVKRKRDRLRRFLIENLENRLLLASDFVYDRSAFLIGFHAKLTNTPTEIRLVDTNTNVVLHTLARADFTGNVNIVGSQANDTLVLDGPAQPFQKFSFEGKNGDDRVTLLGSIVSPGFDVLLDAETITVGASQEIRTFKPGSPSGSIILRGVNIELQQSASLRAGLITNQAGDVTIAASNAPTAGVSVFGDLLSPVLVTNNLASIKLNSATIQGANVSITANSATQTRWDDRVDNATIGKKDNRV